MDDLGIVNVKSHAVGHTDQARLKPVAAPVDSTIQSRVMNIPKTSAGNMFAVRQTCQDRCVFLILRRLAIEKHLFENRVELLPDMMSGGTIGKKQAD